MCASLYQNHPPKAGGFAYTYLLFNTTFRKDFLTRRTSENTRGVLCSTMSVFEQSATKSESFL